MVVEAHNCMAHYTMNWLLDSNDPDQEQAHEFLETVDE